LDRQYRRILIVRTDRLGDVILTLPMAQVLKSQSPEVHVAMLVQRYTADLVHQSAYVDELIFADDERGEIPLMQLADTLRSGKFDAVVHTHPRFRIALATWLSGIPVRVGSGYRWYSILFNRRVFEHRKDATRHELEYNLNLLAAIGCPVTYQAPLLQVRPQDLRSVRQRLESLGVNQQDSIVILHPGSGGSARDWNVRNFGSLAHRLSERPNVKVLVTGSEHERALVEVVKSIGGRRVVSVAGMFALSEIGALASLANVFVANSTGPLHIAAAVGTPVVGLYPQGTALSAARWGPYTKQKAILSPVGMPLDCNTCTRNGSRVCECMDSISVDDVFEAVRTRLGTVEGVAR
jgi:heptosyltransferase-3